MVDEPEAAVGRESASVTESRRTSTAGVRPRGAAVAPRWLIAATILVCLATGVIASRSVRTLGAAVVDGRLVARTTEIPLPPGMHGSPLVTVGQAVEPGTPVARVSPTAALLAPIDASLALLQSELQQKRSQARLRVADHARNLDAAIHATEMAAAALIGERHAAEIEQVALRDRLREPVRAVAFSDVEPGRFELVLQLERATAAADACGVQVELCRQRLGGLKSQRADLEADVHAALGLEQAEAAYVAEQARREKAATESELTSPTYGRVLETARSDGPAAVILDSKHQVVTAELPAELAARVAVDTPVEITFPGGERRDGQISELAPGVTGDGVPVTIRPVGKRWPVAPSGCRVSVRVR